MSRPHVRVRRSDFARAITIYCCKDGSITYGPRGVLRAKAIAVAAPVFSVETEDEARRLSASCTGRNYDGSSRYSWPDYRYVPEDLPHVYATLRDIHERGGRVAYDAAMERSEQVYGDRDRWEGAGSCSTDVEDRREAGQLARWMHRVGADPDERVIPALEPVPS